MSMSRFGVSENAEKTGADGVGLLRAQADELRDQLVQPLSAEFGQLPVAVAGLQLQQALRAVVCGAVAEFFETGQRLFTDATPVCAQVRSPVQVRLD